MRAVCIFFSALLQQMLLVPSSQAHVVVSLPQKEHKVHNIVLYPDKHSWCKTTPIKQVVTQPGCKSVEIDNNVCVGACFSYSIPRIEPKTPGDVQPYCDSCQPSQVKWKQITLECPDSDYGEDNVTLKTVEMISSCACASCRDSNSNSTHGGDTSSSKADLDVPELMSLMMETHNTREKKEEMDKSGQKLNEEPATTLPEADVTEAITERVDVTLKEIDDAEAMLDLEALKEIRTKTEQENHRIEDDISLSSFMEKIKSEQNVRVLDQSNNNGSDEIYNHSRHNRVPGPHHSLVYPIYSLDIAAELYDQEQRKSELLVETVSTSDDETAHQYQDSRVISHQHQKSDVISHQDNITSEDNQIFASTEEKISLQKMVEGPR